MYGHVITKFLTHGAPLARFGRESAAISSKHFHYPRNHSRMMKSYSVDDFEGGLLRLYFINEWRRKFHAS